MAALQIAADDAAGRSQLSLEYRNGCDITHRQFMNHTVCVRIRISREQERKSFIRLHAEMVIHSIVGELAQRKDCSLLVKWADLQVRIDTLDMRSVNCTVRTSDDPTKVHAFRIQLCVHV